MVCVCNVCVVWCVFDVRVRLVWYLYACVECVCVCEGCVLVVCVYVVCVCGLWCLYLVVLCVFVVVVWCQVCVV